MSKAIFLDYTGTMIQNTGEDIDKMIRRIVTGSKAPDAKTLIEWWYSNLRRMEYEAYQDAFTTEEDICMKLLHRAEQEWNLRENLFELQKLNMNYWMQGPLFSDVTEFFENCTLPIYILTNVGAKYVRVCLKSHNLHVHNVIAAEMVKAYKPHTEIFAKALELSELNPEDAIYVGDSLKKDVLPAMEVGMTAILLDRTRTVEEAPCRVVRKLTEVLRYL